ncbi:MAG: helix-turn-helix transcriptional regulator [Ruminococcus sp.]|nr:helix-turn-helix transcriptional regulator [Ruminococcus sp.]
MCIVAENTRRIIEERGLKQKAVAEKAGYTETQFSNLLCGRKVISTEDVIKITKALGVLPNELYGITSS